MFRDSVVRMGGLLEGGGLIEDLAPATQAIFYYLRTAKNF